MSTDCTFCKIISKHLPAEILFESTHVVSILDINPIHHGHALVIPKLHCKDFLDVPAEQMADIFHAAQVVAKALVSSLGLKGFNIFSNNGRIAGQSVFHFHLHVTPRYQDDNIKFVLKLKKYEEGEIQNFARRIKMHIKQEHMSNA